MGERIETLEDVKSWIAEHDGRINAYWAAQHEWNRTHERGLRDDFDRLHQWRSQIDRRINSLEKKVIWLAGFAAGAGSLLGTILSQFIQAPPA